MVVRVVECLAVSAIGFLTTFVALLVLFLGFKNIIEGQNFFYSILEILRDDLMDPRLLVFYIPAVSWLIIKEVKK